MKPSIWDVFSFLLFAASLALAYTFIYIYRYPDSELNPFPPPTPVEIVRMPTLTPSSVALPEIWTPIPETETAEADQVHALPDLQLQPEEVTNTPVLILPTLSNQARTKSAAAPQKSPGILLPTKNPLEPTNEYDSESRVLTITAPIGVFHNTWQNIQSIPSFSWSAAQSVQEIDHFLLYFGTKQNGRLTISTGKMHYNHAAVPSGIYYFRLVAIARDGTIIGSPSLFLFKYDDTPPTDPDNLVSTSTGDTDLPYFTWKESADAHSGMIGGLAGYSIYQGSANRCGKPVAFTTVAHWTPVTPITKGMTEYFCVKAMDAIGNESKWDGPIAYTYGG